MNKIGTKITHQQIKQYLRSSGWTEEASSLSGALEKFKKDNKVVSLVTKTNLPTYESYISDTVKALSFFENEEPGLLIRKIEAIGNHKLSVVLHEGQRGNRIRLVDSQRLRNAIAEVVLSASHSTLGHSINHLRLSRRDALDFQEECYEDQTERGSYIANFLIPSTQVESLSGDEVFQTMQTAFSAAKNIASREVLPSPLDYEYLATQGISANLLKAISDLKDIAVTDNIRFQFDDREPLTLSLDELNNLRDFYSEIITPTNNTETIVGRVIALSAHPECTVTIETILADGRQANIKIRISTEQYIAIHNEEHQILTNGNDIANRPTISVTGTLRTRSKGKKEMVEVTDLQIVPQVTPV